METINRLTADALDSAKFVERIKREEQAWHDQMEPERYTNENRQQRRERERREKKAAAKARAMK